MNQQVEEVPGLYGGIRLEEKIIQEIWKEGFFQKDELLTVCGKKISILEPGIWNLSKEGPDFKNSRLLINGFMCEGDVEIHFYSKDWKIHKHHLDPNYDHVILHLIVFPESGRPIRTISASGKEIPQLVFLPCLYQGIEEYAEEFTLRKLAVNSTGMKLSSKPDGFENLLKDYARIRWDEKITFAKRRLSEGSWEEVCHRWFLEVLGYPRNRTKMHQLSVRHPLDSWHGGIDPEDIYKDIEGWRIRGTRPANHPLARINQYHELVKQIPDWPARLADTSFFIQGDNRKSLRIYEQRRSWKQEVLGSIWKGSRSDTLLVDACLPLWSAKKDVDAFPLWYFWPAGDFPDGIRDLVKSWELVTAGESIGNGVLQALLMHFLLDRGHKCEH